MAAATYGACLAVTLRWEGGWSDHPRDPGGKTMRGVTQAVYDGYRAARGRLTQSVRRISEDELQAIYRRQYWDVIRGDELPAGLDLAVFDYAVNSGPMRAVKALQAILGVVADGHLGEATLGAIHGRMAGPLAAALCDRRMAFLRRLPSWRDFGKGWTRRVDDVRAAALDMARGRPTPGPAREPTPAPPDLPAEPPAGKAVPPPAAPSPTLDKAIAVGTAGAGVVAAITGAIQSPWALAALGLVLLAAGVAAWRFWPSDRLPEMDA